MVPFTSSPTIVRDIRHAHLFCGIGGGAIGFQKARVRVGPMQGRFVCAGGIDVDPGAIRNFERIDVRSAHSRRNMRHSSRRKACPSCPPTNSSTKT